MKISGHKLEGAPFRQAATGRWPMPAPSLLVVHYTATHDADGPVRAFQTQGAQVSAHLVIAPEGGVTQCVEFDRQAAHAGLSRWKGRESCNHFSIGIELVNPGPLVMRDGILVDTIAGRPWHYGIVQARHKAGGPYNTWAAYPDAQLDAAIACAVAICREYRIQDIAGHDDIAPRRKIDPGPAFPLDAFRARVLGELEDA